MSTPGWLIRPSARLSRCPAGTAPERLCPASPSAPDRALYSRRETPPFISQQTLSSITQHHSSRGHQYFFSWLSVHMYIIIFFFNSIPSVPPPGKSSAPPRKKTNPKAQSVPCKSPSSGVPRRRGTRWSQQPARLSPALLVDIRGAVYFFKQRSLCIRCIVARGFVFQALTPNLNSADPAFLKIKREKT